MGIFRCTDSDIWGKFTRASIDVLNESETLFTYTYAERFAARYRGEKLFWSANIRRGMLNTLLIKVLHKDHGDSQVVLDDMVSEILGYVKTEQQWKYISRYFRELCELSPSMVLDRLENEWEKSTGLLQLFDRQSDNFLFERNAYIDILSGVETMLVQKQYAARALEWLLRIGDKSYKYTSNTPESIIHKAICSWINLSAFRTVDEKVNAAKIALKYDRNGWERIYKALPQYDSNIIGNIICPHYREHVTTEWMIAIIRRKDNDNSEKMLTEEESTYINVMCRLYGEIKFCPAERNGKVIESELRSWIEEFMILLEKNDQKSLFSYYIGKMLSYSPAGKDGYYPCEAVRNVLEDYADDALISGYVTEKYNSRGIYSPSDGRTEKSLAARYKENADYLSTIYPKTAKIYYRLCDRYKYEAKWERERAENGVY